MTDKVIHSELFWSSFISDKINLGIIRSVNDGEFLEVLSKPVVKKVLSNENEGKNIVDTWMSGVESHASKCDTMESKLELLAIGVASLLLFVQQNWTGPDAEIEKIELLNYEQELVLNNSRIQILEDLTIDGESIISVVQYPELLLVSKVILFNCYKKFSMKVSSIWMLRCLFVYQQALEETSSKLFEEINNIIREIQIDENPDEAAAIEQDLELARIHLYYNYVQKSKINIEQALKYSGIHTSLTGALGKRTKFQQEDLAQLTLRVNVVQKISDSTDYSHVANLPVDINLDDEVRLSKIKFKNVCDGEHPDLTGLQQAVILGIFCQTQKSQPKDRLADEELQPLISCILDRPKLWCVKFSALLFRSRLESDHKRTIERSMMQIQSLVDNLKDEKPVAKERLMHFFISYLPPRWETESSLAKIMVSMGAIKSALDIYLKLEEWENVIFCYNVLEMRNKARQIIEQELEKKQTPKLWCLLGDATEDVSHYETAWRLSKERSARAQRHWAMFYYNRQQYDKSIKHFELSLEKNSLQCELWYRLGYAALHEEMWDVSANAYRRYCVLDPECFEAWNNLARCYCELKQKERAWRALQEALKIDYSNWRVWDNYMLVSSDLRKFDEVVGSYHQILNFKEKHVDVPILKSVVYGFKEAESEVDKDESHMMEKDLNKFREKLLTLFGRLTSQVISNSELWYLYAEVVPENSAENKLKKQHLLLKAYNSAINKQSWVKTIDTCNEVIHILSKLVDASISVGRRNVLMSCRMSVSGCLTSIKKEHPGTDICDAIEQKLIALGEAIENCQD